MKLMQRIVLFAIVVVSIFNVASALDSWNLYNHRYAEATKGSSELSIDPKGLHHLVSARAWKLIAPFLMPEEHPLKNELDRIFSESRAISSRHTLVTAGFLDKDPEPVTKIIVTRHTNMPGYIFKLYTDDYLNYHHDEPEHFTFLRRARGAQLIQKEIELLGWQETFKVPKKWIYALPVHPGPLHPKHMRRNFILVEEEMDLLPFHAMRKKWADGTMTRDHLYKIHYLTTRLGLRGCCKCDNIPICKDGKIAFVDTQTNLHWPVAYDRLTNVLKGDLLLYWKRLTHNKTESIPTIISH